MLQDTQILTTFLRRGRALLTEQTTLFLGARLRGENPETGFREQLSVALRRLTDEDCRLSLSEQVEVASFFLPLVREQAQVAQAAAPVLVFTAAATSSGGPVRLLAAVAAGSSRLLSLQLFRDGRPVASTGETTLSMLDSNVTGTVRYLAAATYEDYPNQQKEIIFSRPRKWLMGVGPRNPTPTQVALLQPIEASDGIPLVFSNQGSRQSLLLWVPKGQEIALILNPDFGQTNLLKTFGSALCTVPGYGDGTVYWSFQSVVTPAYQLTFFLSQLINTLPSSGNAMRVQAVFNAGNADAQQFTVTSLAERGTYLLAPTDAFIDLMPGSVTFTRTTVAGLTSTVSITQTTGILLDVGDTLSVTATVINNALFGILTLQRIA